ncbi:unnamed protein product [Cuscuta epithymum]|uniref:LOB domain-containing protein n=2 Tax=Cuscuta epithymum TaxID=186058 RepID=A0AAV0CEU2_9ASTE|nr:unnamed protein product [Cuscuta epithymum]
MLMQVGVDERRDAVLSIDYEAQARIKDPVYGCVAHILALQHQVASLQAQLLQVKAQLAQALHSNNNLGCNNNAGNQFPVYTTGGTTAGVAATAAAYSVGSPQSFFDLFDEGMSLGKRERMKMKLPITRDVEGEHNYQYGTNNNINCSGSRRTDLGDLQAVALRMMRN